MWWKTVLTSNFHPIPIPLVSYPLWNQVNVSMISDKWLIKMFIRSGLLEEEGGLTEWFLVLAAVFDIIPFSWEKNHYSHITDKDIDRLASCSNSWNQWIVSIEMVFESNSVCIQRPVFSFSNPRHISHGRPQIVLDFRLPVISYRSRSYFICVWLLPSFLPPFLNIFLKIRVKQSLQLKLFL